MAAAAAAAAAKEACGNGGGVQRSIKFPPLGAGTGLGGGGLQGYGSSSQVGSRWLCWLAVVMMLAASLHPCCPSIRPYTTLPSAADLRHACTGTCGGGAWERRRV